MKSNIAVIAGTSEATELIEELEEEFCITAFVATDEGRKILEGRNCIVITGRKDGTEFGKHLSKFCAVIDASHPFATEVTKNVRSVCEKLGIHYLRLGRPHTEYEYQKIVYADNKEEVAKMLNDTDGKILFLTGSNTAEFYKNHVKDFEDRALIRVLDTDFSRNAVRGLEEKNVIFGTPPFSASDNLKLIREYDISVVVSKDSGKRGGIEEKVSACREAKIPLILIRSPENTAECSVKKIAEKVRNIADVAGNT